MKKLNSLLILFILFAFLSCSNKENVQVDPLIGVWEIEKTVYIHSDGTVDESEPTECFKNSRFEYKPNGSLYFKRVKKNKETGNCEEKPKDFWTGTWVKNKNENYTVNYIVKFSEKSINRYTNSTNTFSFSNENNTLKIYDDYTESRTSFIDGVIVGHYSIYKRVKE